MGEREGGRFERVGRYTLALLVYHLTDAPALWVSYVAYAPMTPWATEANAVMFSVKRAPTEDLAWEQGEADLDSLRRTLKEQRRAVHGRAQKPPR